MAFGGGGIAGTLSVYLNMDSSGFQKGASQAQSSLDSFTKLATKSGKVLSAAVTGPILVAGKAIVGWASDTEEAVSAVTRTYGTAADGVLAWSETTATGFGIAQSDALQTMAVLSATGRAAGMSNQEMAGFGEGMIARSADLASFYNAAGGTNEVLGAMQSALRGEFDPLEKYGIRLSAAKVEAKALEMGLVDSNGVMTEEGKILATNALIMEQSETVAGDFALTSGGLANQQRILMATLKDTGAALGKVLLPYVTQGVAWLTKMLTAVQNLSPKMQKWIVIIAGVAAAIGPILIGIGFLLPAISALGGAIALLLGPIGLVILAIAALAVAYKTNFLGFGDAVRAVAGMVGDAIGRIVGTITELIDQFQELRSLGIDPVTAAFHVLYSRFPGITKQINLVHRAVNNVIGIFHEVVAVVRSMINAFSTNGIQGVLQVFAIQLDRIFGAGVTRVVITALQAIIGAVNAGIDAFKRLRSQGFDPLSAAFGALSVFIRNLQTGFEPLDKAIRSLADVWMGVAQTIKSVIDGDWSAAWDSAKQTVVDFVQYLGTIGGLIWAGLSAAFNAIDWGALWDGATELGAGLLSKLGDIAGDVAGWVADQFGSVNWGGVWDAASNLGLKLLDKLGDITTNLSLWAWGQFRSVDWDAAWAGVRDVGLGILAKLGDIVADIGSWANDQFGKVPWGDIWNTVSDLGLGLLSKLGEISGLVLLWAWNQFRAVNWSGVWDTVKDLGLGLLKKLGDIAEPVASWVSDQFGKIKWDAVWSGAGDLAGTLLSKFGDLTARLGFWLWGQIRSVDWGAIWSGVTDQVGNLLSKIGDLAKGLKTWYDNALASVDWANLGVEVGERVGSLADAISDKGGELIDGFLAAVAEHWKTVLFVIGAAFIALPATIGYLGKTLIPKAIEFIGGFLEGLGTSWMGVALWLALLPTRLPMALGSLAKTFVPKGIALLGGLLDGLIEKWPFVAFWLANIGIKVMKAVPALLETLLQKGKDLLGGLRDGLQDFAEGPLTEWATAFPGWFAGKIQDAGGYIKSKGPELLRALVAGLQEFAEGPLREWALGLAGYVATQLQDAGGALAAKGGEIASWLWKGVTDWLGNIDWASIPGNIVNSLKEAVMNAIKGDGDGEGGLPGPLRTTRETPRMAPAGGLSSAAASAGMVKADDLLKPYRDAAAKIGPIMDTMAATVTTALTKLRTDATAQITGLAATTITILTAWRGAATTQVTQLAQTTTTIMAAWRGAVTAQVTQASTAMIATLTGLRGQMGALAAAAGESFRAGIAGGMSAAVAAAASGAASVRSAASIGSLYNQGYSVGQSMGAGLADGIRSYVNVVASSAASIVNTAISAARTAAAAASPSKKMMALGDDMVEGLLIPLLAGRRDAATAMAALIQTPAFVPGLAGMGGMGARTSGVTWTGDLHVHAAPGMDEQALAERVKEEVYHGLTRSLGLQEGI